MAISVLQKQEGNKSCNNTPTQFKSHENYKYNFVSTGFVSVGLLFLMTVVKTVSSINLLEMAEGPGMESNHVEIEAVQGNIRVGDRIRFN